MSRASLKHAVESAEIPTEEEFLAYFRRADFFNEHNELFKVYTNGILTFIGGDEVSAMVDHKYLLFGKYLQLFNPVFSIWGSEELKKLGKALQDLN